MSISSPIKTTRQQEREMLHEMHTALLHPENGVKRRIDYLMDEIKVNGSVGIENVLKDNYELTKELRTKRDLRVAVKKFLEERPLFNSVFSLATDKRVLIIIIGTIVTWTGHSTIGKFFIEIINSVVK